jgi:ribonuclease P protein component
LEQGKSRSNPFRFRRHNRLLTAAAYGRVFEKAKRSRDKWFTVLYREQDAGAARLGLAVAKKHCRNATARNRIKRVVRESFRQNQAGLDGLDIVVINQPAAATASNRQLFDSLSAHWQRCRKTARRTGEQEQE